MQNLRTVEKPLELLARSYAAAKESGLFEKIALICRLYGTVQPHPDDKNQLHRLVHGDLSLFLESSAGDLTVYFGDRLVCNTQDGNQLFIYGAWVNYIESFFQAITTKDRL